MLKVFYARMLMWTDAFIEYDVLLYLDVDVLDLEPLDDLFETTSIRIFAEAYHGPNRVLYYDRMEEWQPLLEEDGIADRIDQMAANAGVMAIARRYRTDVQYDRLEAIQARYEQWLAWGDQSVQHLVVDQRPRA